MSKYFDASKRWYGKPAARLGYLVGCGLMFEQVTKDPIIAATLSGIPDPDRVLRQAFDRFELPRFGIPRAEPLHLGLDLPRELSQYEQAKLAMAAQQRGTDLDKLVVRLLKIIVNDNLIDNVLDDADELKAAQQVRV